MIWKPASAGKADDRCENTRSRTAKTLTTQRTRRKAAEHGEKGRRGRGRWEKAIRTGNVVAFEVPCFGVLPRNVTGVVEVQQQTFAAVEKSEANKVVVNECCQRAQNDVAEAEAAVAFGTRQLCAQRGIAVHVAEVKSEVGVGVVN